ncbi:MAG: hypothetical protein D3909_12295 [Candidatus Electrothrix sp. ATG1]|nr:hypothetical protein [Candidatus Electrothrix sp. ATG1]
MVCGLSSMAAARFLKENYRQLGSWPMALTAYNYGRSGMVRAKKNGEPIRGLLPTIKPGFLNLLQRIFILNL